MSERLQKRLIGAVVLVALAAIFVPMLFNSGEQTEMPTFGTNLPPKPGQRFETIEVPLQIPPAKPVESRPITTEEEAKAYEKADRETAAAKPADKPAPETIAKPVSLPPPPKPQPPKPSAKPTAPAAKLESGWVVQLGSFEKPANALGFRDKVRKRGYAAFVEQQKSSSGMVYRVRVGPELKRETADALKTKLEKAGFKGVVMPHP